MNHRCWAALVVVLAVVETSAALAGMWIVVALVGMALTYLAGRCDWLRIERRAVWAAAAKHFHDEIHDLGQRLAALEAFEADRAEIEHARIRDGGPWHDNGAGYRSPRFTSDSPAQAGAELSQGAK